MELERLVLKARAEGKTPYFVNATAGTTVFGAFDPINEIADICEKYHLWLHIDVSALWPVWPDGQVMLLEVIIIWVDGSARSSILLGYLISGGLGC